MSSVPTGISALEEARIDFARRSASGMPRRRTPISARSLAPPVFSTISCAKRSSVRRISSADMSWRFSMMRIGRSIVTQGRKTARADAMGTAGEAGMHGVRVVDSFAVSLPASARRHTDVDLSVRIGSLLLSNPVIAASVTFGYGVEFAHLVDLNSLGGIVVKGLSAQPMAGA